MFKPASLALFSLLSVVGWAQPVPRDAIDRGENFLRERKYREAVQALKPLVESASPDPRALVASGRAYMGMRKLAHAADILLIAHQMVPDEPGALYDLGSCLFNQGRYREALVYLQLLDGMDLRGANPRSVAYRKANIAFTLAEAAKRLDLIPLALASYRRAVRLAPQDDPRRFEYHNMLGGLLLNEGQHAKALEHYDMLARNETGVAKHHYHRGVCLMELEREDDARIALEEARRLDPKLSEASIKLGKLYMRAKKYDRAYSYYQDGVERNPLAVDGWFGLTRSASMLGWKEDAHRHRKRYEEVRDQSQQIEDELRTLRRRSMKDPRDVQASMLAAEIFLKNGRLQEALESYNRVLAFDRDNDVATLNTAMILLNTQRPLDGYWELQKILERQPDHPFANLESGRLLLQLNRIPEAIMCLQRCVNELDPARRANAHEMLAYGYQRIGDRANAARHKKEAESWKKTAAGDDR